MNDSQNFCSACGSKMTIGSRFCPSCGKAAGTDDSPAPTASPVPPSSPAQALQSAASVKAPPAKLPAVIPLLLGVFVAGAIGLGAFTLFREQKRPEPTPEEKERILKHVLDDLPGSAEERGDPVNLDNIDKRPLLEQPKTSARPEPSTAQGKKK